ncbi:MAG: DNA-directed RNA polymerase subunit omega [Acidobacteriota bacterium]
MHKLPENIDSKFRFITITAMRAKQLQRGALPKVDTEATKPTAIAHQEVMAGTIDFQVGEDALGPMETDEIREVMEG